MGVESLFKKRKKQQSLQSLDSNKRNKMKVQFFNQLMKSDKRIAFKFFGFTEDETKLIYTGTYLSGDILVEIDHHSKKKEVATLIDDLITEMDYTNSLFESFYGEEVVAQYYEYTYPNPEKNEVLKSIGFIAGGGLKEFSFNSVEQTIVKAVNYFLSGECTIMDGILSGRGTNFLIEQWDLVAFLSKNKGKRLRIELIDETQVEEDEVVIELPSETEGLEKEPQTEEETLEAEEGTPTDGEPEEEPVSTEESEETTIQEETPDETTAAEEEGESMDELPIEENVSLEDEDAPEELNEDFPAKEDSASIEPVEQSEEALQTEAEPPSEPEETESVQEEINEAEAVATEQEPTDEESAVEPVLDEMTEPALPDEEVKEENETPQEDEEPETPEPTEELEAPSSDEPEATTESPEVSTEDEPEEEPVEEKVEATPVKQEEPQNNQLARMFNRKMVNMEEINLVKRLNQKSE